jgi:hypothetical protein
MVQVKADGAMSAILEPIKERAEILNDQGALMGYFEPVDEEEEALYRHAATLFDPEEVQKAQSIEGRWSTTAEILDRLRLPPRMTLGSSFAPHVRCRVEESS